MDMFPALAFARVERCPIRKLVLYGEMFLQSSYQISLTPIIHLGHQLLTFDVYMDTKNHDLTLQLAAFNTPASAQIFNSVACRRSNREDNISLEISISLVSWSLVSAFRFFSLLSN
jgi:hypothetical protein